MCIRDSICGYPRFNQDNPLPEDWPLAAMDRAFAEVNAGSSVELPTAVGFCMYIRRACLDQVGYFDARIFPRGYGEENEFCLRAAEVGFKHLLAGDVFVYHRGGVSFGAEAKALCAEAERKILERYPHYLTLIGDYCNRDPARLLRRRVDTCRLSRSPRPRLLFLTHHWGGGTEKHIRDVYKRQEVIMARVGDRKITVEQFMRYITQDTKLVLKARTAPGKTEILREIILDRLMEEAMFRQGLLPKDYAPTSLDYAKAYKQLEKQNFPPPETVPTEDELYRYYQQHPEAFGIPGMVRVSQIQFRLPEKADEAAKAATKSKAEGALKQSK